MANLSDDAAREFAKELRNYVDTYNLDGINFDDEWSDYNNDTPKPGFVKPSAKAYARLLYETKKIMPDKYVTLYEIGNSPVYSPWLEEQDTVVDGNSLTDMLDFVYQAYYGSFWTDSRIGITRSKYLPFAIDVQDKYTSMDSEYNMKRILTGGYGGLMFYNLKSSNIERTTEYLNKYVGPIHYQDEIVWSGKSYGKTELAD